MGELSPSTIAALCGLAAGMVLGLAARIGRFCTLGAVEDAYFGNDTRRLRAIALAIAVAVAVSQALVATGTVDLGKSIYLTPSFGIAGAVLGGLMFGVGMALVGTCGFGTLSRMGGGDLRAIVVFLVMGVSAVAMMRGATGLVRVAWIDPIAVDFSAAGSQSLPDIVARATGLRADVPIAAAVVLALAGWAFSAANFRRSPRDIVAGIAVGLAVAFGWYATAVLGADPFEPARVASVSFAAPVGEALLYLMTFSGSRADFAIGAVFGVVLGALLASVGRGQFRWEACDDARELRRHISGAFLMGTGGTLAMGCTIGQGITAASALAVSSPVVIVSIVVGARLGLAYLLEGTLRGAFAHAFARQ